VAKTLHLHEVSIKISEKYFGHRPRIFGEFEMKVKQFLAACVIGFVTLLQTRDAAAIEYSFVDVLFPGANETIVEGINDAGEIVGTYGASIDIRQQVFSNTFGFIRRGSNWQSLQAFGASATQPTAINNHGRVVGNYLTGGGRLHGFAFDGVNYIDILPDMATTNGEAVVSDIDDNGVIIGSYATDTSLSMPDPDNLQVHGFRGIPDGTGGYDYESFDFSMATSTYGGGRNNVGREVGAAFTQSILGLKQVGYVMPNHEFEYPDETAYITGLTSINDIGVVVGNAILFDLETITGRARAFSIGINEFDPPNTPTPDDISLPGPSCGFVINFDLSTQEPCRKEVKHINNTNQIVGYYDNNDGILRGFIGTPADADTGDFNEDGIVDAADYVVWRKGLGTTYTQDDFNVWRANFGETVGSGATTSSTIPEPATWFLSISIAFIGMTLRPRRDRQVAIGLSFASRGAARRF
jgi:hypothetical protein